MKLVSFEYSNNDRSVIDIYPLFDTNLIVGKNATGKSRSLNAINSFALAMCGEWNGEWRANFLKKYYKINNGQWRATFVEKGIKSNYYLVVENNEIIEESLVVDGCKIFDRKKEICKVYYDGLNKYKISFKPEVNKTTISSFGGNECIGGIRKWARMARIYRFNADKDETNGILQTFINKRDEAYKNDIIEAMLKLDYNIIDIGICQTNGLFVEERDLKCKTYQNEMSNGMLEALSLIIRLIYCKYKNCTLLLIDDLGECLDFDRSKKLTQMVLDVGFETDTQIIMTTNDKFVMNSVPLKHWQVIQNCINSRMINYQNSKKLFDEFKFTGLSNFDFLSTNFCKNWVLLTFKVE